MKDLFSSYYQPSDDEFRKLWAECLFVFDTNVLLDLYRYPINARDELLFVLQTIKQRLWIPYYVALEFQANRLTVISDQMKRFEDVRNILDTSLRDLRNKLDSLELKRRHSAIDVDDLMKNIEERVKSFKNVLDEQKKIQLDVSDKDTLRAKLDDLFEHKVGSPPPDQNWLDDIYKEGKTRYENSIPPGYKDDDKGEENRFYGGLEYK